ncbi:hypothetical protein [Fulvimarina sp. MAC8]|uniref:hypothetical protein n=1 Tax=Fulvimarina sp. MAC8 TaxID=3162874 RepID=UPI0032EEFF0F
MAEIEINASIWNDLNEEEKEEITKNIIDSGLIKKGDYFSPRDDIPILTHDNDDESEPEFEFFAENTCKGACKDAYNLVKRPCGLIPIRSRRRACKEAAKRAYEACKKACETVSP